MLGFVEHEVITSPDVGSSTEKQKFSKSVLFEIHVPHIYLRGRTFMTSTQKRGGRVLKFVTCLWILLFLNNKSIVYFCGWWEGVEVGVGGSKNW